jgi:predicted transcriptional regulator of viral defense system
MKFLDFQTQISHLPAFNLNDIRKIEPGFHRQQLQDWIERGYIQPFVAGYYLLSDAKIDEPRLFMLANLVYEPSYISRESALAYYQIIPESVLSITSMSSRKTQRFESRWGRFTYNTIKPDLMFGYQVISQGDNIQYKIARREKTVLDFLYRNNQIQSPSDFEGLRWNRAELSGLVSNSLFETYLEIFRNRALESRVNSLLEYIHA